MSGSGDRALPPTDFDIIRYRNETLPRRVTKARIVTEVAYYSLCVHSENCALCASQHTVWPLDVPEPLVVPDIVLQCVKARDRAEHLATIVRAAFASGDIVLID